MLIIRQDYEKMDFTQSLVLIIQNIMVTALARCFAAFIVVLLHEFFRSIMGLSGEAYDVK